MLINRVVGGKIYRKHQVTMVLICFDHHMQGSRVNFPSSKFVNLIIQILSYNHIYIPTFRVLFRCGYTHFNLHSPKYKNTKSQLGTPGQPHIPAGKLTQLWKINSNGKINCKRPFSNIFNSYVSSPQGNRGISPLRRLDINQIQSLIDLTQHKVVVFADHSVVLRQNHPAVRKKTRGNTHRTNPRWRKKHEKKTNQFQLEEDFPNPCGG